MNLNEKKLLKTPITYVKAAANRIDRQAWWYSTGTFCLIIGYALLKLASISTSRVIMWINALINKEKAAIAKHIFINP